MIKKTIKDVELKDRKVLIRVDFNVPMENGVITDDNRIVQALPTIQYVLKEGGKAILFSTGRKQKGQKYSLTCC